MALNDVTGKLEKEDVLAYLRYFAGIFKRKLENLWLMLPNSRPSWVFNGKLMGPRHSVTECLHTPYIYVTLFVFTNQPRNTADSRKAIVNNNLYKQICVVVKLYCSSVLILLASCQQTCITYTIAVCTMKNFWWWTEELSETCRVLFSKIYFRNYCI